MSRQIVLDTETTGLNPLQGHRIIEIGCVEMIDRRITNNSFHTYLNPDRDIDVGAQNVHGISREFLQDKPRFEEIIMTFLDYIKDSELLIHNASFDVGFLDMEMKKVGAYIGKTAHYAKITDTLTMARQKHPGQKNNLDALCKRYNVGNEHRALHGALLDAQILAHVYLAMTRGQASFLGDPDNMNAVAGGTAEQATVEGVLERHYHVVKATPDEVQQHQQLCEQIAAAGGNCLWKLAE